MNLPQLPADKANHALYGGAIFLAVAFALSLVGVHDARPLALAAVVALALEKELSDWVINRRARALGYRPPHGVELFDAAATIGGGLACFVASVLP